MRSEKLLKQYNILYRKLISIAFERIALTRKSKKISPLLIEKELECWAKFEQKRVIASLYIYITKKYYEENKSERYIRGIMRGVSDKQIKEITLFNDNFLKKAIDKIRKRIIDSCKECEGKAFVCKKKENKVKFFECECVNKFKNIRSRLIQANKLEI